MLSETPHSTATTAVVRAPDFTGGIRAAEKAYAKTGSMQDAALAIADHGVPVFPVDPKTKKPRAPRLEDENGNQIDGTGGFKRATCDPDQIREWWTKSGNKKHNEALIGVPMGPRSGVWAVDIDTKAGGHDNDGTPVWQAMQAEHGAIKTRQHQTSSGGVHEIFRWSDDHRVTSQRGEIPSTSGIDIKGDGGYIVCPPSRARVKNRNYFVTRDVAPIEAPQWLYDKIGRAPTPSTVIHRGDPAKPRNHFQEAADWARGKRSPQADIGDLSEAMGFVPNDDEGWEEWTAIGLALYSATGGSDAGFNLFDEFSKKSLKYDERITARRWREFATSPPNRTGAGKIFKLAMANGWKTKPTHEAAQYTAIELARKVIALNVDQFLNRNLWQRLGDECCGAAVSALKIDPGLGKTTAALNAIVKAGKKLIHYCVPTLTLAVEIAERLRALGVNARVFRGRAADDPDSPGDAMCLEIDKVDIAIEAKLDVTKSCCKSGGEQCPSFDRCAYQQQGRDTDDVTVWIFASDNIFHRQDVLGTADALFIDEGFWQKQLRGVESGRVSLSLPFSGSPEMRKLGEVLARQNQDGGLKLRYAQYAGDLDEMIKAQWELMPEIEMHPGMSASQFQKHLEKHSGDLKRIAYLHLAITVLEELRDMIEKQIPVSGRLMLETNDDGRSITWRGVADVKKQFRVPTMLLDATLPDLNILQVSHPRVQLKADVRVPFPDAVRIRQITGSPTSKTKLITGDASEKHREEVLRFILQRFVEIGRKPSLVICQRDFENWLKEKLPPEIATAHFNNIAGLDEHKDVGLLIVIGRPQPGPDAVESIAATLSGTMPECIGDGDEDDDGFSWYKRVKRGIRLRDGSGVAVHGDEHPDELCEAVRKQITEAELLQSIGRARGVNRDDSTPLDINLLFDVVLPIEVDEQDIWQRPSLFISTAVAGVMLTSKADMMKVWPQLFTDKNVADRTIAKGVPTLPGFEEFQYQLSGRNQKWRGAWFDRSLIPDPATWIRERLGPVTVKAAP